MLLGDGHKGERNTKLTFTTLAGDVPASDWKEEGIRASSAAEPQKLGSPHEQRQNPGGELASSVSWSDFHIRHTV